MDGGAEHIQHDTDDIWRGAGKVLALNMLIEQMFNEMKTAASQYDLAFGVDPHDQVSRDGRKNYLPRRDGGLQFCANLIQMITLDGGAVQDAGSILEESNEAATNAAHGGKH